MILLIAEEVSSLKINPPLLPPAPPWCFTPSARPLIRSLVFEYKNKCVFPYIFPAGFLFLMTRFFSSSEFFPAPAFRVAPDLSFFLQL